MTHPHLAIWIAHVADVLTSDHNATDYDATADYAANLLTAYPYLVTSADAYAHGAMELADFRQAVTFAVSDNDHNGGF